MKKKLIIVAIVSLSCIISFVIGFIGGTHTNTHDHLNMNTIVGYDVSDYGILLHTNDGNGYYLEK